MKKKKDFFSTAVILAGGRSKRMGFDKQLLEKDNRHLAVFLSEELLKVFKEVIIVTNTPELYEELPVRTCQDIYPGQGPLSGIHSAFHHCNSEVMFVMACDMTAFGEKYARYQAARMLEDGTDACVTQNGEKLETFHAFYSRNLLPDMEKCLIEKRTSAFRFLREHHITEIAESEMEKYSNTGNLFLNLNTPQEYEAYKKSLSNRKQSDS